MKNFPHQFAKLEKLTAALKVASTLIERGQDLGNDTVYGSALARAGVYQFRGSGTVAELLRAEANKAPQDRGTLTAARELRRFLVMCGFLSTGGAGIAVTPAGQAVLAAEGAVLAELWRRSMLDLGVSDAQGRVSHPYRILLRLVTDRPGLDTSKLMLVFEAVDDSEAEYARVLSLIDLPFGQILDDTGISTASARNAIKILPSIAEQVGDIRRLKQRAFPAARFEVTEDSYSPKPEANLAGSSPAASPKTFAPITPDQMGAAPNYGPTSNVSVDLTDAIALRKIRTNEHQAAVRSLAQALAGHGYALSQHPFDCLAIKARTVLLIEVKTLDGSPADERKQCERAIGQILGYRHFNLPSDLAGLDVTLILAFSRPPSKAGLDFLKTTGALAIWLGSDGVWSTLGENDDAIVFEP